MSRINKNISDEFRAIVLIGILFFIFGFVTWLNSILIPYLRIACELDNFQSYLVTFAFYIATFAMAIPSASIIKKTGFRDAMTIGLLMMAVGAALFIPAAMTRTYSMFLFGLFVTGSGMTLLQTAANPYISVMGPLEFAARRISIMGVFNKTAGILSPLILGAIILKGNENIESHLKTLNAVERAIHLDELAAKVILPYLAMSLILAALSVLIRFSGLPEINLEDDSRKASEVSSRSNIFQFPGLVLGVISLFLYIGVEVMAGDTIISYGISQGIPFSEAKIFSSYTLTGMVVGYLAGIIFMPRFITQERALQVSAILGILFSIAAIVTNGFLSVFFIALLGFANALMWPAHWPLAIKGLGKFTGIGSSWLIMSIAGGAIIPLGYGLLADAFSPKQGYWLFIPCYIFILYYAVKGHKKTEWKLSKKATTEVTMEQT